MKKIKYVSVGFLVISFCLFWVVACNAGMGGGHHGGNYDNHHSSGDYHGDDYDHHGDRDYRGRDYNDHHNDIGNDHGYGGYDGQNGSVNRPPHDRQNGIDRDNQRSPQRGSGPNEGTNSDRPRR